MKMSLSKSKRERLIGDYLLGIENPTYEVSPKNDGGWIVRKRKKKSPFTKTALKKIKDTDLETTTPIEAQETPKPDPKPEKRYDTLTVEEISELFLEKLAKMKEAKKKPEPEPKEEEDVDQTPIKVDEPPPEPTFHEYPYMIPQQRYPEPSFIQRPVIPPLRRRTLKLY
jgi:hypothetical protein